MFYLSYLGMVCVMEQLCLVEQNFSSELLNSAFKWCHVNATKHGGKNMSSGTDGPTLRSQACHLGASDPGQVA